MHVRLLLLLKFIIDALPITNKQSCSIEGGLLKWERSIILWMVLFFMWLRVQMFIVL